jgi:hypothetical protein
VASLPKEPTPVYVFVCFRPLLTEALAAPERARDEAGARTHLSGCDPRRTEHRHDRTYVPGLSHIRTAATASLKGLCEHPTFLPICTSDV